MNPDIVDNKVVCILKKYSKIFLQRSAIGKVTVKIIEASFPMANMFTANVLNLHFSHLLYSRCKQLNFLKLICEKSLWRCQGGAV